MTYSGNTEHNRSLTKWKASTASADVKQILEKNPNGAVHSVFNNSFNLIFGKRIIHVGATQNGVAPFGIGMNQTEAVRLTKQIKQTQSVGWNPECEQLSIGNIHLLSLKQAVPANHFLATHTFNPSIIKNNLEHIAFYLFQEKLQTGLVQTNEEKEIMIKYILHHEDSSISDPTLQKLKDLELFAKNEQGIDAKKLFDYWIGRGPGLTPSGDDLITGMCAILSVLDGPTKHVHAQLERYILLHGLKRTTQISNEYLLYATKHKYHSHLVELSRAILKSHQSNVTVALEAMEGIGHTSGTDTLIGVLLGMKIGTAIGFKK